MHRNGVKFDRFSFSSPLNVSGSIGCNEFGEQLHGFIIKQLNCSISTPILNFQLAGKYYCGIQWFQDMQVTGTIMQLLLWFQKCTNGELYVILMLFQVFFKPA